MNSRFNVVQVGLGAIGRQVLTYLLQRENINVQAVIDINPDLINKKISEIIKPIKESELKVTADLEYVLKESPVDVVIILTSSSLEKIAPIVEIAAKMSCNVISICEELSYPFINNPKLSTELDDIAKENNISIVGTGINPGFLMDLLPIMITAPCQKVDKITVTRLMNSAKRRNPFQAKIGTGLSLEVFERKISEKEITGHVGLTESIQMITSALGIDIDEIKEFLPEAIIADKMVITSYCTVSKGDVCGLKSRAIGRKGDNNLIELIFIAYAGDHDEYDSILIDGIPEIHQIIKGGIHGDLGTVAMVSNLIPIVYDAKPGLLTMKDIPVPRNTTSVKK